MTEDDINAMVKDVESHPVEIEISVQRDWLTRELNVHKQQEKEIILTFKTHKHLRNDIEMKNVYNNLVRVREIIKYLQGELSKL